MGLRRTLSHAGPSGRPQRVHNLLRDVFNALRWIERAGAPWRMLPNDFPPWEVVYQQTQRWISAGVFEAMVHALRAGLRQEATGESVELVYVDRSYKEEEASAEAKGIRPEVVKHPGAKKGFVLLSRRCLVERSFAWASRFRRLAKDYELLPQMVAGLHFVAFACLFLHRAITVLGPRP